MSINLKLIKLRKNIRNNKKRIIDTLIKDHQANLCIFCGATDDLTREHVIPQWVYKRCTKRFFITNTNGSSQTYNKTTVPACKSCNSNILGFLERQLKHEFERVDVNEEPFSETSLELIILWLETLEYKFQVLDLRRKLNRVAGAKYIPYIGNMPISMFQGPIERTPEKVFSNLRNSLKTLGVKSKSNRINSLVVFSTSNQDFHFFHSTNNFIFIELTRFGVAFFYFINDEFECEEDAQAEAQEVLRSEYQ